MESIKLWCLEAARLALSAGISAVLTYLLSLINSGVLNGVLPLSPEVYTLIMGVLTAAIKSADRAIHENDKIKMKGLLPF